MGELFPKEYADSQMDAVRRVIQEDRATVFESQSFINGSLRWYRTSIQPIHTESGKVSHVLVNTTDIDNLKTIQQELQELNRTLEEKVRQRTAEVQDLYDNAPVGYHSINAAGQLSAINQTEVNWLGYSHEELLGKPATLMFTPENTPALEASFEQFKSTGKPGNFETVARRKDGTTFPVVINAIAIYDESGQYLSSRSTMTDITQRKLAENELKRNVNFINALLDAIPTPVFYKNKAGEYLGCNRAFTEIMGKTAEQIRGKQVLQLWPNQHANLYRQKDLELLQNREPQIYEAPVVDKNGNSHPAIFFKAVFYDDVGEVAGLVGAFIDITERKQAEETLRHANVELARAMRMKDEFLANMSHELRTPLNGILGLSEALQMQVYGTLGEKQLRALKNIENSGHHLLNLINDILDLSKVEAGKLEVHLETVIVSEICQSSLGFVKEPALKKGLQLNFVADPLVTTALADARRLKQILVNLLSNAVKFTPANGQVTLSVQANLAQHSLEFSVIDTGIGIAPEDLRRLFSPFTQVDSSLTRKYEGTGLGLALVKELTELHGGSVSVQSEVGQGSTFTVSIPWQPGADLQAAYLIPELTEANPEIMQEVPKSLGKILLADDVESNSMTIGDYLESVGFELIYAINGVEAIEKTREFAPDLILMDVQMPTLDGLEATRQLRADPRFTALPIIALTAMAMTGDEARCLEAGATAYVSKPVGLKHLEELIRDLLDKNH
jgi:PAS domain S-box-containing protein